jgi:peptide/nickel transport system permease protein
MPSLLTIILRRLGWALVVLLGLSVIIFSLMRIIPGDPARLALGPTVPEEIVEQYRERMHYNEPLPIQYYYWIAGVVKGDFGKSTITNRPVSKDIKEFISATAELVIWAGIMPIFFALLLGVLGAMYKNRWPDYLIRFSSYVIIATPTFVWAVFFLLIFGYWLPILPSIGGRLTMGFSVPSVTGLMILDAFIDGQPAAAWDAFLHLSLPALALALPHTMQESRITRSYMIENEGKDYITMITSQGVPRNVINRLFLLKPSVIPTISIMGLDIASIFANAFLVETIFNWPGISRYALKAILGKDINAVCGVVMLFGVIFILTNILVDIVAMILDPRIRQSRSK